MSRSEKLGQQLGTTTFLHLESLLLLPAAVHFCAGSSTVAAESPDCCPTVLERGQVCKSDVATCFEFVFRKPLYVIIIENVEVLCGLIIWTRR